MKKGDLRILPLAAAGLLVLTIIGGACSTNECYDNKNSLPLAGFYVIDSIKATPVSIDSITIYGIGAPGDSILQDSVKSLSQCYLPFRIDENSTSYVFQYLQGVLGEYRVADTITFNYEIKPFFVSSACGVVYDYKMTSIETTHNLIDSVTCPDGEITNVSKENLRIYFKYNAEEEAL